ncbi:MAG: hypothetical protein V3V00_14885 [Saprospiraceae bacterium]
MNYNEQDWILFKSTLKSSLKSQFFELLQGGYSEREIALKLFRSEKIIASHRNIKSDVKEALQNEILNFFPSNYHYSRFQRAYYQATKQQAVLKYLVGLGMNSIVEDLAQNLVKRAIYFEITEIIVDVSRILILYFAEKNTSYTKVKYYSEINRKFSGVLFLEMKAERTISEIKALISENIESKDHIIGIANDFLRNNPLPDKPIPSHRYYYQYYPIVIYLFQLKKDYQKAKDVSLEAYDHFCHKRYEHISAKRFFLLQIITSELQLDSRNVSFEYIESTIELSRKGDVHWFDAHELKIRASLSSGNYDVAAKSYNLISGHHNYNHQPLRNRIRWTLLGVYVQFLIVINLTSTEKPSTQYVNKHFKFLAENKKGLKEMKVPFIIAELLFSIYHKDYDAIETRIYRLKGFCNVYLKKATPNYRSSCFIKMILTLPINNFSPEVVQRRVGHYSRKLEKESFVIDHSRIVEILPYEELWSIILKYLEKPKRVRRSEYDINHWKLGNRDLS